MVNGSGIGVSIDLAKGTQEKVLITGEQSSITVSNFLLRDNGFVIFLNGSLASTTTYYFIGQVVFFHVPFAINDEVIIIPIG